MKIAVATTSRADYGLLRSLLKRLHCSERYSLLLFVSGSHLSPEHGETVREIEADGIPITKRVEILLSSNSNTGAAKTFGLAAMGFADTLREYSPDWLLLLGDRYEVLAIAATAAIMNVPIAHLHGGESTLGAIDDAFRHAITKLSSLHFVATDEYRRRVIQMGERPETVVTCGGLGVSAIHDCPLYDLQSTEEAVGLRLGRSSILVTYHPETRSKQSALDQVKELLAAIEELPSLRVVFTGTNADPGNSDITDGIKRFVAKHPTRAVFIMSLGQTLLWSVMSHVGAVVGNSSSGILEAPSFRVPTVNIGDRQTGRVMANSVITTRSNRTEIAAGIRTALSEDFRLNIAECNNPYDHGDAVERIVETLTNTPSMQNALKGSFVDITEMPFI